MSRRGVMTSSDDVRDRIARHAPIALRHRVARTGSSPWPIKVYDEAARCRISAGLRRHADPDAKNPPGTARWVVLQ